MARSVSKSTNIAWWAKTGLKIAVCAGLMIWIVGQADLDEVWSAMSGADLRLVGLAMMMQLLGAGLIALRWQRLLSAGEVRPGFMFLWGSCVSAFFFRQFLPSVIGGDAIRSYDAWRAGARPAFAALSLVADRLFGLLALLGFLGIAALGFQGLSDHLPGFWLWTAIATCCVLLGLAVMLMPTALPLPSVLPSKLRRIIEALRVFEGKRGIILPCFGLSILLQVNVIAFYWVLAQSLGIDVPFTAFFAIVPVAIFAMMAPLTINGIGIREAVFVFLLGLWNVDPALALAFAWTEFATILATGLLGGVVHALRGKPMPTAEYQHGV